MAICTMVRRGTPQVVTFTQVDQVWILTNGVACLLGDGLEHVRLF